MVIMVQVVLLGSRTCSSTFTYSTWYYSTLVLKKKSRAQGMQPTRYVRTTYAVLMSLMDHVRT